MSAVKHLTAEDARKIVQLHAFPISRMLEMLIRKAEYRIRIIATLKGVHTFWSVPFIYTTIPAYDSVKMTTRVADHLAKRGFHVKVVAPCTIWVSWRYKLDLLKASAI